MNSIKNIINNSTSVFITSLSYYCISVANFRLLAFSKYSEGIHWIYLPSGIVLISILLFAENGAVGIAIASSIITQQYYVHDDWITSVGNGLITGFSPLAARAFCISKLNIDANLNNLNGSSLMIMSLLFCLLKTCMRELWLSLRGHQNHAQYAILVSVVGDFVGALAILYLAKIIIASVGQFRNKT